MARVEGRHHPHLSREFGEAPPAPTSPALELGDVCMFIEEEVDLIEHVLGVQGAISIISY